MNARDELTDFIGDLLHKAGVLDSLTDDEQAAPVHRKVDGLLNAASAEVRVEMTLANADWLEGIGQDHAASMLRYSLDLDAEMADAAEPGEKVTPTPAPAPVESAGDEAGEAERLRAELERLRAELAKYVGVEPTIAEEMAHISGCLIAVQDVCRQAKRAGNHRVSVATVEQAVDGERPDDPDDLRRRLYIDGRGNSWIDHSLDDGTQYIVQVGTGSNVGVKRDDIRDETGSLREIGRCW